MGKFTFKTEKSTGSYSSFFPDTYHIKLNKKKVGSINDRNWKIRLMVIKDDITEDGNPNCEWRWITLKRESKSLQEAKQFLNDNFDKINAHYKLYQLEN